nr:RecName: Full=Fibrinogen beta chain; Contains: RecName: Full=Fibrinopeptide B [Papio hamadryas]prf//1001180D fibrinopeptide B [Papio hamadryas]
NQEGLFHGR